MAIVSIRVGGQRAAATDRRFVYDDDVAYGSLPEFYLDLPFTCRKCGKKEIWKARDQKWYYEEAKGHIDARAVECHDCRTTKKK